MRRTRNRPDCGRSAPNKACTRSDDRRGGRSAVGRIGDDESDLARAGPEWEEHRVPEPDMAEEAIVPRILPIGTLVHWTAIEIDPHIVAEAELHRHGPGAVSV